MPTAGSRVFFQAATGVGCVGSGPITAGDDPVQKRQGKVTVKYDRKELRKRLVLEEWIIEQLSELYDCEEEEMPEVEIDIDDLLEVNSDDERASKLQVYPCDYYCTSQIKCLPVSSPTCPWEGAGPASGSRLQVPPVPAVDPFQLTSGEMADQDGSDASPPESQAIKEAQWQAREERARQHYEKQLEERKRKLEEQRLKEDKRRAAVEEKRRQKLEEDKARHEAVIRRTLERSQRTRQKTNRWSWGGALQTNTPSTPADADRRSVSTMNLSKHIDPVITKRLSSSSATLLHSPDRG
ncbi:Ensconsin, partial [Nibea albiflora]